MDLSNWLQTQSQFRKYSNQSISKPSMWFQRQVTVQSHVYCGHRQSQFSFYKPSKFSNYGIKFNIFLAHLHSTIPVHKYSLLINNYFQGNLLINFCIFHNNDLFYTRSQMYFTSFIWPRYPRALAILVYMKTCLNSHSCAQFSSVLNLKSKWMRNNTTLSFDLINSYN